MSQENTQKNILSQMNRSKPMKRPQQNPSPKHRQTQYSRNEICRNDRFEYLSI